LVGFSSWYDPQTKKSSRQEWQGSEQTFDEMNVLMTNLSWHLMGPWVSRQVERLLKWTSRMIRWQDGNSVREKICYQYEAYPFPVDDFFLLQFPRYQFYKLAMHECYMDLKNVSAFKGQKEAMRTKTIPKRTFHTH